MHFYALLDYLPTITCFFHMATGQVSLQKCCSSHLSHVCYIPNSSRPHCFNSRNNIWWQTQITELITWFSPASPFFISLALKQSPHLLCFFLLESCILYYYIYFLGRRHLNLKRTEQKRYQKLMSYHCFRCTRKNLNVQVHQGLVSCLVTDISVDSPDKCAIKHGLRNC